MAQGSRPDQAALITLYLRDICSPIARICSGAAPRRKRYATSRGECEGATYLSLVSSEQDDGPGFSQSAAASVGLGFLSPQTHEARPPTTRPMPKKHAPGERGLSSLLRWTPKKWRSATRTAAVGAHDGERRHQPRFGLRQVTAPVTALWRADAKHRSLAAVRQSFELSTSEVGRKLANQPLRVPGPG